MSEGYEDPWTTISGQLRFLKNGRSSRRNDLWIGDSPLRSFAGLHNECMTRCEIVLVEVLYWSLGGAGELRADRKLRSTCWKRMSICEIGIFHHDTLGSFGLSAILIKASRIPASYEEIFVSFSQGCLSKLILSGHILSKKLTSSSSMRSRSLPVSLMSSLRHKNVSGPSAHPILDLQSPVFDLDKPSW
jgi:hypothetical protein